ncbi:MAG: MMPL family transporter [Candidatus Aminicenantes bacterium]|nr:MMPL family transporter [Candidatus Aminicenantes bacterium]NIM79693.1 MMPL family transporter [Candidatus Aminicenantes bacterium]NIN19019.1 MMPL family transporter [Candidatus Aminicenantes bacterium]NIN42921.1 MMPL family transporter [Candidatus Aminicenantes bacterium]NIN85658.1 MMPL family transporter [Candidatus Aminicenantes bacterium]
MNLPEFSIKRPVTVIVAMLIFITIGVISILKLPLEMYPDTSFPGLMVYVPYPSSSPEEVERTITRPLEEILSTVNNLKNVRSTSSSSNARIFMELDTGTNMDMASMEIRDKIDQVRGRLPDDLERIRIRRWSTSDRPVISFSVSIPGELEQLYFMAENVIQPQLERIDGVANVEIRGLKNKELTIALKPDLLYTSSINLLDLIETVRNNNINISAGYLESDQRYVVRVPGELKHVRQINELPLNEQGLRIKDVADVTYDYPTQESFDRLNSRDSLSYRIYRASNANVVDVCRKVMTTMEKIKQDDPLLKDMDVLYYRDQSEEILNSLRDLSIAGLIGGFLAVMVLLFFLRKFRSTIVIAVAIPMAIVFTFSLMYIYRSVFGASISINVISLSGLMMAVGMLVDNSVVVLENIFRLRQEKGYSALEAAVKGGSEVALAVTASTLTTLVVFISLGFISSTGFGRYMRDFAITISLALIASLIISLTFIPLAGSRLLRGKSKPKARWLVKLTGFYEKIIGTTIKTTASKLVTVFVAICVFGVAFYMMSKVEREYFPPSEERNVRLNVFMPKSFTLDQMKELFNTFETMLNQRKQELAIKNMVTEYGITRIRQGRYRGEVDLYLAETGPSVSEIKKKLLALFPRPAGITYEFGERHGRGGHFHGLRVELVGMDFTRLTELAPMVMEKLRTLEEVEDLSSDLEGGDTQLLVKVDRKKAESTGVDSRRVARTIMSSISDRPIGKFKTENKEIDIVLKMRNDQGFNQDDLKNISMRTGSKRIPISAISDFSFRMGSTAISKENKKSKLRISINTKSKGMMKLTQKVREVMSTIHLPEGYSWSFGSHFRRFQEAQKSSSMAVWLALIFIYIIMASLFESFVHPFTILLTVPLALFGVAFFFTVFGITLNNSSYLGLLTLFGIVVNNGIILIDHIRSLRKKGMAKREAIIQGGKDRMRPIIMTAITTIFGVLPLALPVLMPGLFPAAQGRAAMWAPISVAILGGLTTSTFFTLIILPTFYSISDSVTTRFKNFFGFVSNNR